MNRGDGVVFVEPPGNFAPSSSFEVAIAGDAIFEPPEQIVIALTIDRFAEFRPPPMPGTALPGPGRVVRLPDVDRIKLEFPTTTIIIREGILFQV